MKTRACIAVVLQLFIAWPSRAEGLDGGSDAPTITPASGFVSVETGIFLTSKGTLMNVDGGAWADDATLIAQALEKRALKEEAKLAGERQQQDITQWVLLGAAGGAVIVLLGVLGVIVLTAPAQK